MTGQEAVSPAIWAMIHGRLPDGCGSIQAGRRAALAEVAALVAERDRYRDTLEEISEESTDEWAATIARAALAVSTP